MTDQVVAGRGFVDEGGFYKGHLFTALFRLLDATNGIATVLWPASSLL
jgi:hypothetical protein